MRLRNRLAKLEKQSGGPCQCPHCQDSPIEQICLYELQADGTERLTEGTPPAPCPVCGKVPGIVKLIVIPPALQRDTGQCSLMSPWNPDYFKYPLRR
jgi:hypothetical protein